MRKMAVFLGFSAFLGGCAAPAPFQADALPGASATLKAANEQCAASIKSNQGPVFKSFSECLVMARFNFSKQIGLKGDDTLLKAYVARMGTLAGEADGGSIQVPEFVKRLAQISDDFDAGLVQEYRINAAEREQAAAQMQAFGAAMSQTATNMQAAQPVTIAPAAPISAPLSCQSYKVGFVTQTNCN